MKREIKIIPLVLAIWGLIAVGFTFGTLSEHNSAEIIPLTIFGAFAFVFILLMSVGFPFTREDREETKINW